MRRDWASSSATETGSRSRGRRRRRRRWSAESCPARTSARPTAAETAPTPEAQAGAETEAEALLPFPPPSSTAFTLPSGPPCSTHHQTLVVLGLLPVAVAICPGRRPRAPPRNPASPAGHQRHGVGGRSRASPMRCSRLSRSGCIRPRRTHRPAAAVAAPLPQSESCHMRCFISLLQAPLKAKSSSPGWSNRPHLPQATAYWPWGEPAGPS